jgi:predicted AlkP superfamily pyrophosphatase or phosphodiesterase
MRRPAWIDYRHVYALAMPAITRSLLLSALFSLPVFAVAAAAAPPAERTVVVLLFDGVPPALLEAVETPACDRIRAEGTWSNGMQPAFPTISLINGVTISTGCWPERHGIVTNKFLDPARGLYDHSSDADWLTGCEHLHQAAERQGVRAAALGWYGARSASRGPPASAVAVEASWGEFPGDLGRAEQVVAQLARTDAGRPRLILAYFNGPDGVAHFEGMDSQATREATRTLDRAVARVMEAIESGPHAESSTLFVTTDHGMRPVERIVNIQRILIAHDIDARALSTGTTSFLYFDDLAGVEAAFEALSGYAEFEVLRPGALPDYAHLGSGPRVGQLIVSAHPPHFIEDADTWPWALRWLGRFGPRFLDARLFLKATHGYPPETEGMAGILYAWGDGIARGREVARARAIDLHPTVTELLGIATGQPVDGSVLRDFLD